MSEPPHHEATRLESFDDIRALIKAQNFPTSKDPAKEPAKEPSTEISTAVFRPTGRPPMAMVCALDDGETDGEWVRVRRERFVIGRVEGDLVIPHDALISGRHAEISRHLDNGRYRWYLTDLNSTNGTFVRVSDCLLRHGQELLVGGRRFRFDSGLPEPQDGEEAKGTKGWQAVAPASLVPKLVEVTPQGDGEAYSLNPPEVWLGRDPKQCAIAVPDDLMMSPRHVRLYRERKGWHAENAKAPNGTWVRISRVPLDSHGHFQLGEQRFVIRIPG